MSDKYEVGTRDLAVQINEAHEAAVRHAEKAIDSARQCGELLIQAKEQARHGEWLPWLREHCTVGERQAQKYMKLAKSWPEIEAKTNRDSDLSIREAMALLEDERKEDINDQLARDQARWQRTADEVQTLGERVDSAADIDELLEIINQSDELHDQAAENRIRAMRRLGELIPELSELHRGVITIPDTIERLRVVLDALHQLGGEQ